MILVKKLTSQKIVHPLIVPTITLAAIPVSAQFSKEIIKNQNSFDSVQQIESEQLPEQKNSKTSDEQFLNKNDEENFDSVVPVSGQISEEIIKTHNSFNDTQQIVNLQPQAQSNSRAFDEQVLDMNDSQNLDTIVPESAKYSEQISTNHNAFNTTEQFVNEQWPKQNNSRTTVEQFLNLSNEENCDSIQDIVLVQSVNLDIQNDVRGFSERNTSILGNDSRNNSNLDDYSRNTPSPVIQCNNQKFNNNLIGIGGLISIFVLLVIFFPFLWQIRHENDFHVGLSRTYILLCVVPVLLPSFYFICNAKHLKIVLDIIK